MSELVEKDFEASVVLLGRPLWLAGPYLSHSVLSRLAPQRVLVDVEAWAASSPTEILETFDALEGCEWRHLKGLHAKLAVGPEGALVGSANFTQGGMSRNVELGVLLPSANEAQAWFARKWAWAKTFEREDLERYLADHLDPVPRPSTPAFRTSQENAFLIGIEDENARELRDHLALFQDYSEALIYLQEAQRMLARLGIFGDDARISITLPRSGWGPRINIGNTWAMLPIEDAERRTRVRLIFPHGSVVLQGQRSGSAIAGEWWDVPLVEDVVANYLECLIPCENLLHKGGTPLRRHHRPLALQSILNPVLREEVLTLAFEGKEVRHD